MIIIRAHPCTCDSLVSLQTLPSTDALRPLACPGCGFLAHFPDETLGIVGHGTYQRQVLGLPDFPHGLLIFVRRYRCQSCKKTITVLPDFLHPRRWYAAPAILYALCLHLLDSVTEAQIRRRLHFSIDSESWRSLRRWRSQLFVPLFHWQALTPIQGPAETRHEGRRRLRLLLNEALIFGVDQEDYRTLASQLLRGHCHLHDLCWLIGHDPPDSLKLSKPKSR